MSKILKIRAGVRYYEDSLVNGTSDIPWEEQKTGEKPRIPCVEEDAENRQVYEKWVWCICQTSVKRTFSRLHVADQQDQQSRFEQN